MADASDNRLRKEAENLFLKINTFFKEGYYTTISVTRPWSEHNRTISGDTAGHIALKSYLVREMEILLEKGATISIEKSQKRDLMNDPELLTKLDEQDMDYRQKKLFLFGPQRFELSINRLEHYTGTKAEDFQRYILLTNYQMHMQVFEEMFPKCVKPDRREVQMPAYHAKLPGSGGISIVNIGVGPSNAKTITDHLAVLRPDVFLMVGHCGGLRNHQKLGDFVLATGYVRDDAVLDEAMPLYVPITPHNILNINLMAILDENKISYRVGTIFTTGNRNWEFSKSAYEKKFALSRSVAVEMESATVATNGFRYRIPNATLLVVSDKPLHGLGKLPTEAIKFYEESKRKHIEIAVKTIDRCRIKYPNGFGSTTMRGYYDPVWDV